MAMYEADPRAMGDMDLVRVFPLDDRDVVIAGFPKSGTNWMQVMLANLWDDWTTTRNERKQVPHLAGPDTLPGGYLGHGACLACEPPRLMKFHPPREYMPERWPDHGKVVHITRNPMDVCVSMYHHFKRINDVHGDTPLAIQDWDTHVEKFVSGEVLYGPYIENIVSWETFDHPNLLKLTYEETRRDTKAVLRRIAGFLGRDLDDERLDQVAERTEFSRMRQDEELKRQMNIPYLDPSDGTQFMRKGEVGDWRTELPPEAVQRMQDELVRPLEEAGVRLQYV